MKVLLSRYIVFSFPLLVAALPEDGPFVPLFSQRLEERSFFPLLFLLGQLFVRSLLLRGSLCLGIAFLLFLSDCRRCLSLELIAPPPVLHNFQ